MLITFTGAQSTGKTTLLRELKSNRALSDCFHFVENITRNTKQAGFPINEEGSDATQLHIMDYHWHNIMQYTNAILDRCAIDGFVYTKYLWERGAVSTDVFNRVQEDYKNFVKQYDIIFYLKPEFDLVIDGVRSSDESFRTRVSQIFEEEVPELKAAGIPIYELHGSVEERLVQIQSILKKRGIEC